MIEVTAQEERVIQITMLKYIDKICRENKIDYFLIGGSLIGAIRHDGFIPWDDDIDIGLTKDNYDKLCAILSKNNEYLLMNRTIQKDYVYPFSKLVDIRTSVIEKECRKIENYGVYVDIMPFYNVFSKNKVQCLNKIKKVKRLKKILGYSTSTNPYGNSVMKNIFKSPIVFLAKLVGYKRILKLYDRYLIKNNKGDSKFMICGWPCYSYERELYYKEDIQTTIEHTFEGFDVKIPKGYHRVLTNLYGDYMTPPPIEKQIAIHNKKIFWKK